MSTTEQYPSEPINYAVTWAARHRAAQVLPEPPAVMARIERAGRTEVVNDRGTAITVLSTPGAVTTFLAKVNEQASAWGTTDPEPASRPGHVAGGAES